MSAMPAARGSAAPDASLATRGLCKRYGERTVVDGVALEVHRGEVVGLLGPNGAGKTTTFNMIVGGVRPDGGQVLLGDRDISALPMYRRARLGVVYLPQEPSIFRRLTVAENVLAILETVEPDGARRRDRLEALLSELGIVDKARQRGDSLSGGERRRVEVARALVLDPKFLLLDEPFTGIDPIAVIEIQKLVEQLKLRGIGIVITEHKVREALAICDRAYILQAGQIIREGTPAEIAADPQVRQVYLGENFQLE
jgi:lipopolysaccharide export system ATP-binding protein